MADVRGWVRVLGAVVLLVCASGTVAGETLAFVTDVAGQATVARADGRYESAYVGTVLYSGDAVRVVEGRAVVVYLSGRSVTLGAGITHQVRKTAEAPSRFQRLMDAFRDLLADEEGTERPAVFGFAADAPGLRGAPANTRVSRADFRFAWEPVAGAAAYAFRVEAEGGEAVAVRTLADTAVSAGAFDLEAGRRYFWTVEARSDTPRTTGELEVYIASAQEAKALQGQLAEVGKAYRGATRSLMQAAVYYREGYYYEAAQVLEGLQGEGEASPAVERMLNQVRARMASGAN